MKKIILFVLLFMAVKISLAQQLVGYDYWYDNDYASVTHVTITNQTNLSLSTLLNASSQTTGIHTFHIRFKDTNGKYSTVLSQLFYKSFQSAVGINNLIGYEYWFDNDYANHISVTTSNASTLNLNT